ncbi:MAG: hypothetical protein M1812_005116 [Candelaria pacifica]|nr:MAG: hypothetical protein M1812_005116 [Candelaria pacifica]
MKKNNPHTPIMMREALGTEPKIFTRYGEALREQESQKVTNSTFTEFGKEKQEQLIGLSEKEIEEKVTGLVKTGI